MELGWALLLALCMGILTFRSPLAGLCVFAALLPFDMLLIHKSPAIYSDEALLAGLLIGMLAAAVNTGSRVKPEGRKILILYVLVLATAALSAWAALYREAVLHQALRWGEFWLLLAAAAQVVRNQHDAKGVLGGYLAGAAIVSVLGIMEVVLGPDAWINHTYEGRFVNISQNVVRAHGGSFHPNSLAPYLGLALLSLMPLFQMRMGGLKYVTWWGLAALLGVTLLLTQSRAGWIAVAAGIAVCAVAARHTMSTIKIKMRHMTLVTLGMLILILASTWYSPSLRGRVVSLATPWKVDTLQWRMQLLPWGIRMWAERPLIGIGAGNFLPQFKKVAPRQMHAAGHIHNFFLQIGLETGLLGLTVWLVGFSWIGVQFWRSRTDRLGYPEFGLGLLALFIVNNQFDHLLLRSSGVAYALGFGVALGVAGGKKEQP